MLHGRLVALQLQDDPALNRPRTISTLVNNTKKALNAACGTNSITLRWIKSHKGHLGNRNEMADKKAKDGALNANLIVDDIAQILEAIIKRKVRNTFE